MGAVYLPFLQKTLHTVPLGWQDWLIILAIALPIFAITELYKWLYWRRDNNKNHHNIQEFEE
jgi:Ca2+-transporting ATPase